MQDNPDGRKKGGFPECAGIVQRSIKWARRLARFPRAHGEITARIKPDAGYISPICAG